MPPPLATSSSSHFLLPATLNPIQFPFHSKSSLHLLLLLHRRPPRSILKTSPSCSYSSSPNPPTYFPYSSPRRFPVPRPKQPPETDSGRDSDDDDPGDGGDLVIGDCLVFDEGAFEDGDPFFDHLPRQPPEPDAPRGRRSKGKSPAAEAAGVRAESLVPEKWREVVQEINLSKKEKRRIAHELRFGSRMDRRAKSPVPDMEEYREYRLTKLAQLNPVVLDEPRAFPKDKGVVEDEKRKMAESMEGGGGRVAPKNPRLLSSGPGTLEDLANFFSSTDYVPRQVDEDKKPQGRRKLFTNEEKFLLNRRIPNLAEATSNKWLPLHSLASSGEFYLLDTLLKHNVEINAVDKDGLTALHKAILCKKQAIINYLLRNSANPFIRDRDGATLLHYAVQTASSETIKILLLYNVDINLADDDGWTPLHLAIQTKRTDIVRLLLIKGADKTLKNQDGLTPLDICLYSGHDARTYELIKLLKQAPLLKSSPCKLYPFLLREKWCLPFALDPILHSVTLPRKWRRPGVSCIFYNHEAIVGEEVQSFC